MSSSKSWTHHFRGFTLSKGPKNSFVSTMAALNVSSYTGHATNLTDASDATRESLEVVADYMSLMNELNAGALFICALWTSVNERVAEEHCFLDMDARETCIQAASNWAIVLLAHRAFTCGGQCPSGAASNRAYVWDTSRRFQVSNDWHTGAMSLALTYDVLFQDFSEPQRVSIRSALALLVMNKESWGNTVESSRNSPNAELHPHRIFSNWATYHSNLYLTNLAIEGESGFDVYASAVLSSRSASGFNEGLDRRFSKMLVAWAAHSVYPDGSTFEDGYTYFIALREGSLGLIAAERRGYHILDQPRFRGLIHNLVQMSEPWHCGRIIGHASGGGLSYPAYTALFRYVYSDGVLPGMQWKQRHGDDFKNGKPCRTDWYQNMVQMAILGGEHNEALTTAGSPQGLTAEEKEMLPLSYFTPRRGLLIARNGWSERDSFVHFDARPDAFFPGHDNADRGVFTFSSLRQTWLDDLPDWRNNIDSRKHSLLHIDGLAEDEKAPPVPMFRTVDDGDIVIAAANLTYAYNVQWARNWPDHNAPTRDVIVYESGRETKKATKYTEKEEGDPRAFGWPLDDDGDDVGFTRSESNLWGDADVGFMGMYTWKRNYRETPLLWMVRSTALVRARKEENNGYLIVADSVKSSEQEEEEHVFESYLVLHDDVEVDDVRSACAGSTCAIRLMLQSSTATSPTATIIANTPSEVSLSYRIETFKTEKDHSRVVISGRGEGEFQMWLVVHAQNDESPGEMSLEWTGSSGQIARVRVRGENTRFFSIDDLTHSLREEEDPAVSQPSPSSSPSSSCSVSPSKSPALSNTASPSMKPTITSSPSLSATPSPLVPPMSPIVYSKNISIRKGHLISDEATFFALVPGLEIDVRYQTVFKVLARSVRRKRKNWKRQQYHRIRTCFRSTRAITRIIIYYCGPSVDAMKKYMRRDCEIVAIGESTGSWKKKQDVWTTALKKHDTYFVVVMSQKTSKNTALTFAYDIKWK